MEILKFPDPALFVVCKNVSVFGPSLQVLLDSMWDTMKAARGLGIAANQVGYTFRMFVMEGPNEERIDLVNPQIVAKSSAPAMKREGCLSAPGEFVLVPDRVEWVQVEYQDVNGDVHLRVFKGLHSVCVQHEIEHLDGKAFLQSKTIPKSIRQNLTRKWGID